MALSNLIGNAIKACKNGGIVEIGCYSDNLQATLFVRDNGVGMTEEQTARITEPFYRTDKSRNREQGGTGLGLALCERIAKAHGASLRFESSLGKGTTAYLSFPLKKD
jgi:signal transduction histidine kinase